MQQKRVGYLGLAKKSNSLVTGYCSCLNGMVKNRIRLLVLAEDLGRSSFKKMSNIAYARKIPVCVFGRKQALSQITGEIDKGIFGITNEHLALAILNETEGTDR
jgi:ribosomal protein L7Ae-like RNA K-turn-binding protein